MDWFRLYHEFATDPKVQSMSEAMQRRLIMLMCLRCSNTLETLQEQDICFALRIDETELAATKALFMQKKFIDERWEILQWDKRQKPSDSSTERVRRHREMQKQLQEQECNVTETAQIREEKKRIDKKDKIVSSSTDDSFERFWQAWPRTDRKQGKAKCAERWAKADLGAKANEIIAHVQAMKSTNQQWRTGYEPAPLTYLNQRRWEDGNEAGNNDDARFEN
ncbi:hypothetical protein WT41_01625 [Burkholderia territorii]|uniref:hypothetical protein n=1 Tax=Burkholderia territorii TaxID=1503055 RepID=UPI00075DBCA3|nr:hypothetical protein [Burkholderia territorii]KWA35776.1 hypothetical protein WT41_01625 [Burkholderia territorii]